MLATCITELSLSTYKEFFWFNKEKANKLPKNVGKIHEQAFSRKKTTMTHKHMKSCSTSFVNKNWYIGTIRKYHFTFASLENLKSWNFQGCEFAGTLLHWCWASFGPANAEVSWRCKSLFKVYQDQQCSQTLYFYTIYTFGNYWGN